jgi:hypothetical protein
MADARAGNSAAEGSIEPAGRCICWHDKGRRIVMNLIAPLAGAALVLASSAAIDAQAPAAPPATVCLNVNNIQRTEVQDDRTILFHMRDGKVWINTLRRVCPMLKTSPYTQVLHNDQVCSNQQFIHVTQTGDTCALGDFTQR